MAVSGRSYNIIRMSKMKTGAILCAGAILLSCCAPTQAQDMKFLMTFVGNTTSNNANGSLISVPMTEQAWLNDSARFGGRSTTRGMAVVYHVNADSLGDSIEVIDTKTGEVLNKMFSLYFGEDSSLGRTGITNAVGTKVKKIHYVYTYQNSHSVGAAILAESFYK